MFISDIKASQIHLSWHPGKESYLVTLSGKGDDLAQIELSQTALQSLVLQALAYMPQLELGIVVKSEADAFRKLARSLKGFDNRSIQLLLREVQSDTLVAFLWYMKDGDLVRLVCDNMSKRAGEMLLDDLENAWTAWVGCLNTIGHKIRRQGLMAMESDIEFPNHSESPFCQFPQTLNDPYLEFA